MYVANYYLQGDVTHGGLPQWLAEHTGLDGRSIDPVKLVIWVNSSGGDLVAAFEAINLIKSSPIPVITVINGAAESAALLIAAAGHKRFVFKNSWGMAHHFSTGMEGNYHDLMDSVKHNNILHDAMLDFFLQHSNMTKDEILADLLGRHSLWLTAEDLVKRGMADEVLIPSSQLLHTIMNHGTAKKNSKKTR